MFSIKSILSDTIKDTEMSDTSTQTLVDSNPSDNKNHMSSVEVFKKARASLLHCPVCFEKTTFLFSILPCQHVLCSCV